MYDKIHYNNKKKKKSQGRDALQFRKTEGGVNLPLAVLTELREYLSNSA